MTPPRTRAAIARGVLLGTFAGDAVGARWEGAPAVTLPEARARLDESLAGDVLRYTDDTQLALALAEHLCDHPAVHPPALVERFLDHFEPHRGYARGMFGLVDAWREGMAPERAATAVFPDGSFGNGAAMRVAPVGVVWLGDAAGLDAAARRQAAVTHAHPVGMDAAAVQAHAVAVAAEQGTFDPGDLEALTSHATTPEMTRALGAAAAAAGRWRDGCRPPPPEVAGRLGTGVLADQSVPTALWVAAVAGDVVEAAVLSLALGGDVDTIAAMACAVLGGAQLADAVPSSWVRRLEDTGRGLGYTLALADRLAAVG